MNYSKTQILKKKVIKNNISFSDLKFNLIYLFNIRHFRRLFCFLPLIDKKRVIIKQILNNYIMLICTVNCIINVHLLNKSTVFGLNFLLFNCIS